jgi:hypothetical protein
MTKWSELNRKLLENARIGNWRSYRDIRLDMADDLNKKNRTLSALTTYLEVSYIDSNGPTNIQGRVEPEATRESTPFDPSVAVQSPRVVGEIYVNIQELGMSNFDLNAMYIKAATTLQKHLKTPVSPEDGWKVLETELWNYRKGLV